MIEGSNMAECHPVAFRWVMKAREAGATVIHVDPRFTRTSAVANMHVPIRAGTDIAFLGGIIRYIVENERYFKEYLLNYTNATAIINKDFKDTEELDGLFGGWDEKKGELRFRATGPTKEWIRNQRAGLANQIRGKIQKKPIRAERTDPTLQDPRCVLQILKRHYARYTPEMVEQTCGIPQHLFLKVAEALCRNSGRDRTAAFVYAVGWTQHTVGVQYIRAAAIIQLLLGNMGRPGGGIMALRGHASIQGSTDIPTLYNLLPGYLPMPKAKHDKDFETWVDQNTSPSGWWGEFPKYAVSLFKAWYGEAARKKTAGALTISRH